MPAPGSTPTSRPAAAEVERRDLADYDRLLGIDAEPTEPTEPVEVTR